MDGTSVPSPAVGDDHPHHRAAFGRCKPSQSPLLARKARDYDGDRWSLCAMISKWGNTREEQDGR